MKFLKLLLALVLAVGNFFGIVFTIMKTYNWFIIPQFPIAPTLNYSQWFGLLLVWCLINFKTKEDEKDPDELIVENIIKVVLPWFMLFIIWIIKLIVI